MKPRGLLRYFGAQFAHEAEEKHRQSYQSLMLYYIAQPTRKHPEALPVYTPLGVEKMSKPGLKAQEILSKLLE